MVRIVFWPERTLKGLVRAGSLLVLLLLTIVWTYEVSRFNPRAIYLHRMAKLIGVRLFPRFFKFEFKDEAGGNGITEGGNSFSFHLYGSDDGVGVLTYIETCPSAEDAKKRFDETVKQASSISARGPRLDKNGKQIGERVVLTLNHYLDAKRPQSFVCWTVGPGLHWVQSESLIHAVAYEKTLYP